MTSDPSAVASRQDLAAFVSALRAEHDADPEAWENNTLERFSEALAAWITDSPGHWANQGLPDPERPNWAWVARALRAATLYE